MLLKWCLLLGLTLFEAHFASATVYANGSKVISYVLVCLAVLLAVMYRSA